MPEQKQVLIRMTPENAHAVKAMAHDMGVSVSKLVTLALDSYMDGIEVKDKAKPEGVRSRQVSVHMPDDIFAWMEEQQIKTGVSLGSLVKVAVREHYKGKGCPQPKQKVKRAPRNPTLSHNAMIEAQAEIYNDNKNWKPVDRVGGDRLPNEVWLVTRCYVEGCKLDNYEPHKHANRDLAEYWRRIDEKTEAARNG